jgi:hypothetical protein
MTDQNSTGGQGTGGAPDPYGAPQPGAWQQPGPPAGPSGQWFGPPPGYGPQHGPQYGPQYGPQPGYGGYPPPQRTNGLAVASMVLGILWIYWIGSILALVFGYIARKQIRERGETGSGMAVAGIVLGWVGVGILLLALVFGFAASLTYSP